MAPQMIQNCCKNSLHVHVLMLRSFNQFFLNFSLVNPGDSDNNHNTDIRSTQ